MSQIGIFQEAEFMVIMTGAAVTNLAFSKKLKHVIFIIGSTKSNEAAKLFWPQYAQFLGLDYTCLFGAPDSELNLVELRDLMMTNLGI
jgi:hypothetical protein